MSQHPVGHPASTSHHGPRSGDGLGERRGRGQAGRIGEMGILRERGMSGGG